MEVAGRPTGDVACDVEENLMDESLRAEKLQVERKQFYFDLKENPRGRFLRITEDVNGRRDSIIIPATGLPEVRKILDAMISLDGNSGNGASHAQSAKGN
jgi:hypothetical protein